MTIKTYKLRTTHCVDDVADAMLCMLNLSWFRCSLLLLLIDFCDRKLPRCSQLRIFSLLVVEGSGKRERCMHRLLWRGSAFQSRLLGSGVTFAR